MQQIDAARYPLDDLGGTRAQAIVDAARTSLKTTGCATLPNFLTADALACAADEAAARADAAFAADDEHNAYQLPTSSTVGADHVRNMRMRTRVASIAYDEIGPTLAALYASDELLRLVEAILSKAPGSLHRLADPLGACTVNVFRPGWSHAFHFDEAEFTVTLCLRPADAGGHFVFTPPLRASADDLAAGAVAACIGANTEYAPTAAPEAPVPPPPLSRAAFGAGTLQIFAGRYSLHAVTEVERGDRLVAVLCFSGTPGVVNSPEVQRMFWGREVPPPQPVPLLTDLSDDDLALIASALLVDEDAAAPMALARAGMTCRRLRDLYLPANDAVRRACQSIEWLEEQLPPLEARWSLELLCLARAVEHEVRTYYLPELEYGRGDFDGRLVMIADGLSGELFYEDEDIFPDIARIVQRHPRCTCWIDWYGVTKMYGVETETSSLPVGWGPIQTALLLAQHGADWRQMRMRHHDWPRWGPSHVLITFELDGHILPRRAEEGRGQKPAVEIPQELIGTEVRYRKEEEKLFFMSAAMAYLGGIGSSSSMTEIN